MNSDNETIATDHHGLDDHRNIPQHLPPPQKAALAPGDSALVDDSDDDEPMRHPSIAAYRHRRRSSRRHEGYLDEDDTGPGFVRNLRSKSISEGGNEGILRNMKRRGTIDEHHLNRYISNESAISGRPRRASHSSINSDADSHGSRTSQETEEDVCFPLIREHVRVNGIDFDEIEEFIKEERDEDERLRDAVHQPNLGGASPLMDTVPLSVASGHTTRPSKAALKYTPKGLLKKLRKGHDVHAATASASASDETRASHESVHIMDEKHENPRVVHPELAQTDEASSYASSSGPEVKFGGTRITGGYHSTRLPDRFSFFYDDSEETIHSPDIPGLLASGQSVADLFRNGRGTWWLDCTCPTDAEMKVLAKAFGIHPLTAEDIRMQETREKVELFRNYYFVCFHTFEPDQESADYLEPINVYIVVFKEGVISFHFSPINHPASVRRRVRQLRDYVDVSADWICYALIDDITDAFVPVINNIEFEADAIEDEVFVVRDMDFAAMLQRIGESRRKVMTLMRLLSGKADVIKMFAKRCQDEAALNNQSAGHPPQPHFGNPGISFGPGPTFSPPSFVPAYTTPNQGKPFISAPGGMPAAPSPVPGHHPSSSSSVPLAASPSPGDPNAPGPGGYGASGAASAAHTGSVHSGTTSGIPPTSSSPPPSSGAVPHAIHHPHVAQPRADIALYLGDIQDHVVTMFQNLLAYEKIFSRSHGNYLAQLQVESFYSNNRITEMFSKITLIGTVMVPLNLVTGLFGMNVTVPGEATGSLNWWFSILGVMLGFIIIFFYIGKWWLANGSSEPERPTSSRRSIKSLKFRQKDSKSILSFPNKWE
ncbi:magnesium transporter Alr1p [Diutina catenulata]